MHIVVVDGDDDDDECKPEQVETTRGVSVMFDNSALYLSLRCPLRTVTNYSENSIQCELQTFATDSQEDADRKVVFLFLSSVSRFGDWSR